MYLIYRFKKKRVSLKLNTLSSRIYNHYLLAQKYGLVGGIWNPPAAAQLHRVVGKATSRQQ